MTAGLPIVIICVPLLLGLVGLLTPQRNRPDAAALGVSTAGIVLLLVAALLALTRGKTVDWQTTWVHFGEFKVTLSTHADLRAMLLGLAVAVVALCVQIYSVSYLRGDDRYGPYAAQISIFVAAMLAVVFSGDLILLLIGWEVMGACSYLLIAHDRRLPEAPAAAVKAFLVTRVGDVGFLLGIVLLGVKAGTFHIAEVLAKAPTLGSATVTTAALLILAGVAGKSAQFPLHTWLPDAMAGPTPISALIHAATMVAAGVYVVARLFPVFHAAPTALDVLGIMAAITLLLGALAAIAADDVKRVLAWSTVSQLGYMMAALSVGAVDAAMFHLLMHAAFKALLFLAAGSLIHAVGSNLLSRMGGLRRDMPVTFWTMSIGLGALAGLPPLAGFWSKEEVLAGLDSKPWLSLIALLGVGITAWYSMRVWLLAFFGPMRTHGHDPRWDMRFPLVLLAIPSFGLGIGVVAFRAEGIPHLDENMLPAIGLALGGMIMALVPWGMRRAKDPAELLGPVGPFLASGLGLDTVQRWVVVKPVLALASLVRRADWSLVDGAVMGIARTTDSAAGTIGGWHRAALPRALAGVLLGAAALTLAGLALGVW